MYVLTVPWREHQNGAQPPMAGSFFGLSVELGDHKKGGRAVPVVSLKLQGAGYKQLLVLHCFRNNHQLMPLSYNPPGRAASLAMKGSVTYQAGPCR